MVRIGGTNQWAIEKRLFTLKRRNPVLFPVLKDIPIVPLKTCTRCDFVRNAHSTPYMTAIYIILEIMSTILIYF